MKRYDLMCGGHYADTEERDDQYGKYVKAEVAQALYDALQGMLDIASDSQGVDGYHLNGDVAIWDEFPEIENAAAALSLADGNGDE